MSTPIDLIRGTAQAAEGQRYIEERFGPVQVSSLGRIELHKAASANPRLLRAAAWVCGDGSALELYELLGGTYR